MPNRTAMFSDMNNGLSKIDTLHNLYQERFLVFYVKNVFEGVMGKIKGLAG